MTEPIELIGIHEGVDRSSLLRVVVGITVFLVASAVGLGALFQLPRAYHFDGVGEVLGMLTFFGTLFVGAKVARRLAPRRGCLPLLRMSTEEISYWPDGDGGEVLRLENSNLDLCATTLGTLLLRTQTGQELSVFRYYQATEHTLRQVVGQQTPTDGRFALEHRDRRLGLDYLYPVRVGSRVSRGVTRVL